MIAGTSKEISWSKITKGGLQIIIGLAMQFLFLPAGVFAHPNLEFEKPFKLAEPFQVEKGKKLFQDNGCTMCHGEDGSGNGPMAQSLKNKPRNFRDYSVMQRMPDIRMEQAIRQGLEGTAMPAFTDFTDEEVASLVAYLHSILSDSHTILDMCLYKIGVLDTRGLPAGFSVKLDEPERFRYSIKDGRLLVAIRNWGKFLQKKSWRGHFRIMDGDRIYSLVTVRIKPCLGRLEQLVKSLPCGKH